MADIYKMDTDYLSAESVYDRTLGKTQKEINSAALPSVITNITAESGWAVDAVNITKTDRLVSGTLIMHTTAQWSANNNNAVASFGSSILPLSYQMMPASITPGMWSNTAEKTNVAYLSLLGKLVCNWSSAIDSGKYLKIAFCYTTVA